METLRCTRLDAVSYAEGLLQLMENACLHSQMQRSYISVRISDVNIMAGMTAASGRGRPDPSGYLPAPGQIVDEIMPNRGRPVTLGRQGCPWTTRWTDTQSSA